MLRVRRLSGSKYNLVFTQLAVSGDIYVAKQNDVTQPLQGGGSSCLALMVPYDTLWR